MAGAALNTGEQITEAVNWAITCGVPVQLGTIDPEANITSYNVRDVTVAETIQQMVRWTPDVICWFDYTTSPPTFHCRKLANLTNVPLVTGDLKVRGVDLQPMYDLVIPAVCLRFKAVDTIDGRPSIRITEQNSPAEATGQELGASVHTIELAGAAVTNVYGELVCAPCNAQHGTAATRWGWWADPDFGMDPTLGIDKINPSTASVTVASIVDANGDDVNLALYPNVLQAGQVAPWMRVGESAIDVVEATVTAIATFDVYRVANGWTLGNADKFLIQKGCTRELSVRVKLTNGVSGTYSATGSSVAGEDVPLGLADEIRAAHSVLQYQGTLPLVAEEVPTTVGMGNTVDINTGTALYEDIMVQGISEDLGDGSVVLQLGPASHLGIADLIELLRVNRYRVVYNNPLTRVNGSVAGGGTVTLGKHTSAQNTCGANSILAQQAVSALVDTGKTAVISKDASGKELLLEVQDNDGAGIASEGKVSIKLSETAGKEIKLREWDVCVEENGVLVTKKALFLSSPAYNAT